jgi:hypothetical protein
MKAELEDQNVPEKSEFDARKREFIKKFGTYTAGVPIGMYLLMSPSESFAISSGEMATVTSDFNSINSLTGQPGFATDTVAQGQARALLDQIYKIFGWSH